MSQVVEADGLRWYVGGTDTDDHLTLGGHERALGPILQSMCDPDRAYVNAGAHVGTWALRLAAYVKVVYAVEANIDTYYRLSDNIELNQLGGKVLPLYATLWDENNQLIKLVDENGKTTGGSTRVELTDDTEGNLTTTFDTLFEAFDFPIGLVSMDVEGAEAKVLAGAERVIMRDRPNLLIELHDGHPGTDSDLREQVYELLKKYDYSYESLHVAPPEEHLYCVPAERAATLLEPEVAKAGDA